MPRRTLYSPNSVGARMSKKLEKSAAKAEKGESMDFGNSNTAYDDVHRFCRTSIQKGDGTTQSTYGGSRAVGSSRLLRQPQHSYPSNLIPTDVLDDICFRFLINIPDEEKRNVIRICFQLELAHWFYIDFYCKSTDEVNTKCVSVGLRDFIRQVFHRCEFLSDFADRVDEVIDEWREYKSSVPTYGAILLDKTLNYVLLVHGYYAAKNSWGFPKGKVNENEDPMACAAREVLEEVGYDISEKMRHNQLIQKFINETMTRLYIIEDVPVDFPFSPRTRNEIGKIQWFPVWDLPVDRTQQKTAESVGYVPNSFYTVIPFVSELQAYISRQQNKRIRMKSEEGSPLNLSFRSASAFDPVPPQRKPELGTSVLNSLLYLNKKTDNINQPSGSAPSLFIDQNSPNSAFFKPVNSSDSIPLRMFSGDSFMQLLTNPPPPSDSQDMVGGKKVARPVPTHAKRVCPPIGVPVYEASRDWIDKRDTTQENITSSACGADTVTSSASHDSPNVCKYSEKRKETSAQRRARRMRNHKTGQNVSLEHISIPCDITTRAVEFNDCLSQCLAADAVSIVACDAWKNFKLDTSKIFLNVAQP
ncbi:hypothetical protein AB6A40_001972 [Gnathostoma spinigerum]|uniref:m7GpppN-mRNA hydrolase n=1 Tax=Gnathostoma spinigerum TaxID=75299 RepID=A0ABD6E5G5_9BILA